MISSRSLALPNSSSFGALPYSSSRRTPRCAAAAVVAPPARSRCTSLYEILGVAAAASGLEIKAAYRRLARACHPDAVAADRKGASADEFMRVHAAYETLSDPEKRADYDRMLIAAATAWMTGGKRWQRFYSPVSHSYPAGCRRSRTWETDQCW